MRPCRMITVYRSVLLVCLCALTVRAGGQQSVTTYHYDNYRTGWNSNETILTPANVNPSSFGLLHTSISSKGTSNAIIWALSHPASRSNVAIYLYAFNPDSGTDMKPIFRGVAGAWPNGLGNSNLVPVVANGEVFVASHDQLQIFGLKAGGKNQLSQK